MGDFEELMQLPGTPQEKIWLEERMETLSAKESIVLSAALMRSPAQSTAEAINHILTLEDYEVCSPAGSYAQLGRFYLKYESTMPKNLHEFVDAEKLGEKYEDAHPGLFIGDCYVQYPSRAPAIQYDGTNLGTFADTGWSVKLKLASEQKPEGVWLRLPDFSEAGDGRPDGIRLALNELGVETIHECTVLDAKCVLPEIRDLMEQYSSLDALFYDGQSLGFALDERNQGAPDFEERLAAALEYEHCHRLDEALDVIQNLHCFDIVPVDELREYAVKELKKGGVYHSVESISDCFDYESYATELLDQRRFILTRDEQRYVGRNGNEFIAEHCVQQQPSMTMG